MERSEEAIAFLAVTDYQEFIPLLAAAASSKDVVESGMMLKGVLSDLVEDIRKISQTNSKLSQRTRLMRSMIS